MRTSPPPPRLPWGACKELGHVFIKLGLLHAQQLQIPKRYKIVIYTYNYVRLILRVQPQLRAWTYTVRRDLRYYCIAFWSRPQDSLRNVQMIQIRTVCLFLSTGDRSMETPQFCLDYSTESSVVPVLVFKLHTPDKCKYRYCPADDAAKGRMVVPRQKFLFSFVWYDIYGETNRGRLHSQAPTEERSLVTLRLKYETDRGGGA